MTRTYLVRGMLVGLLASIAAFGFAKAVGEPQIAKAEQFEEQHAAAHEHDDPTVSRGVQDTAGLGTGLLVAGAALGGLFGLAFAFAHRRLTRRPARVTAALLAGGAFVAVYLVPWLKYPPNPPAVGNPDTIGRRTALYFLLLAMSLLATALAYVVRDRLRPRLGTWNAGLVGLGCFVVVVAVVFVAMPGVNEVPATFPTIVLWRFRLASLGTSLLLWTGIGVGFGALTERAERRATGPVAAPAAPAAV
jgi:predicted cobalt transporter CbtA